MREIQIGLAGAFIATAVATSLLLHQRTQARLRQTEVVLRQRDEEIGKLTADQQRLSNRVAVAESVEKAATNRKPSDNNRELEELRAKVEALREQTNMLAMQVAAVRRAAGTQSYTVGDSNLLDHNAVIESTLPGGPRACGKLNDARAFTAALRKYAEEHQNEIPSSLEAITDHLPKPPDTDTPPWANSPITGTNDFEIVFEGSLNDLSNIPPRRVALIRERQPWQTPEGKWARVYGFADGAASTVESDDNFETWNAQHVLPSTASNR